MVYAFVAAITLFLRVQCHTSFQCYFNMIYNAVGADCIFATGESLYWHNIEILWY